MLATAVELDLDIVWVVMNNNAYGTIAGLEKAHFGAVYGTTFPGKPGESLPELRGHCPGLRRRRFPGRGGRSVFAGPAEGPRHRRTGGHRRPDEEQPDPNDRSLEHPRHLLPRRICLARSHRLKGSATMAREITAEEKALAGLMLDRARAAMAQVADYDQARVDRLVQALGWAVEQRDHVYPARPHGRGRERTRRSRRTARQAVQDPWHPARRAAAAKSIGIIEEDPDKGLSSTPSPLA